MEEGLSIALSPVQLAAILTNSSISEGETFSNRLWGGVGVVGGLLEMGLAGGMCLLPEPTTLSKVGCVVVGTHGVDVFSSSLNQVFTGRVTNTHTHKVTASLAEQLGADKETANNIGLGVDLLVPMGFASVFVAARIASIQSGKIRLIQHEAIAGSRVGGHTLDKHVGKSKEELLRRLADFPRLSAAGSFYNLRVAEQAISEALKTNQIYIKHWASSRFTAKLEFDWVVSYRVGVYIKRGATELVSTSKFRVVLKAEKYNDMDYYVLTAFPRW
ncbi:MAG: hypothetical protein PHR19_09430 [Bacteroidales bacterium]|nr:hypothetical protein [Bacteroidales bacterium]